MEVGRNSFVEALEEFYMTGMRLGIEAPFKVLQFNKRKGEALIMDAKGRLIEGKRTLVKGQLKWVLSVKSTQF